ncbi:MAG: 50S ribosomal protein L33 [Candidatus Harrisonbacteria bacterium]|nr:50S ribosomal protein L33 [Candidatus Harrisonbacteria bacterium]
MYSENLIRLRCTTCKQFNYYTRRNKKTAEKKLELQKFCKWCVKRTLHKEFKK